jgi:hypothetical protein
MYNAERFTGGEAGFRATASRVAYDIPRRGTFCEINETYFISYIRSARRRDRQHGLDHAASAWKFIPSTRE